MQFSKKGKAAVAAFVPRREPDGGFSVSACSFSHIQAQ
jgi:hypothetical protein